MRTSRALPALLALPVLVLGLAACGEETGDAVGRPAGPRPTAVPAADGPVRTADLATVMDTGRPELCLGAVAESYPPQCGGPALLGWEWSAHRGAFERVGKTRWGQFMVTGTWDGTALTVTDAVPAALYDAMRPEPTPTPSPATAYSEAELARIAEDVGALPGAQGAYVADGQVHVDVTHDDGSLQGWVDAEYGENVVLVRSALVRLGRPARG